MLQAAFATCLLALSFVTLAHAQAESYSSAGINNATLRTSNIPYTDATGASLRVSHQNLHRIHSIRCIIKCLQMWISILDHRLTSLLL